MGMLWVSLDVMLVHYVLRLLPVHILHAWGSLIVTGAILSLLSVGGFLWLCVQSGDDNSVDLCWLHRAVGSMSNHGTNWQENDLHWDHLFWRKAPLWILRVRAFVLRTVTNMAQQKDLQVEHAVHEALATLHLQHRVPQGDLGLRAHVDQVCAMGWCAVRSQLESRTEPAEL